MKHLHERGYYENLYDRLVVNRCRSIEQTSTSKKMLDSIGNKAPEYNPIAVSKGVTNLYLYFLKGDLAIKRDETIREWMEDDKEKDDILENAHLPNQYCIHCNKPMELKIKDLYSTSKKPYRVQFGYSCKECKYAKFVFDNGEEERIEPSLCKKCKSKNLDVKFENTKTKYITTTTCKDCGYIEKDETDRYIEKIDENFEVDRLRFCLSEKETYEFMESKRQLDHMGELLKKWEEEKDIKEEEINIKSLQKLDIVELKNLLIKNLKKPKYSNIELVNPQVKQYIGIDLNLFIKNSDTKEFSEKLSSILSNTNWEIIESSIVSKLGILCCKLRGFEKDPDLVELIRKRRNTNKK